MARYSLFVLKMPLNTNKKNTEYCIITICVCLLPQRGELASDRARDTDTKALIVEAMSQQRHHSNVSETTTEELIETMRTEISSAAAEHRDLVNQLTSSSPPLRHSSSTSSCDRLADGVSSGSETRSASSSAD